MPLTLGVVNLSDRSKYKWIEGDESPNYNRQLQAICGGGTLLIQSQLVAVNRPYTFLCLGADEDTAFGNLDTLVAELQAAKAWSLQDSDSSFWKGYAVLLVRTVGAQTTPTVWTVIDFEKRRVRQAWDGMFKVWIDVTLICAEGGTILTDGATVFGSNGAPMQGGPIGGA